MTIAYETSRIVLTLITDLIDKNTLEIKQDEEKTVYKNLEDIGEDLPDHSPRFILLSYPLTLVCPSIFLVVISESRLIDCL